MARNLQELQKQYNSSASAEKRGMPMMRGPGGPRGMGKGKPKNTKNTIKRLFTYVGMPTAPSSATPPPQRN